MAERYVLHSTVCILLHDIPTNISQHKHTYDSFATLFIYLLIYDLFLSFTFSPQEYSQKKNAKAMPTQRELGSMGGGGNSDSKNVGFILNTVN
jgi:hypothetical protein